MTGAPQKGKEPAASFPRAAHASSAGNPSRIAAREGAQDANGASLAGASAPRLRVFAGTTEGRLLCEWLAARGIGARAYAATEYGGELIDDLPGVEVRTGRLGEREMEAELAGASVVVDATHPFASLASANIRAAAKATGARYVRLRREEEAAPGDVIVAGSVAEAARALAQVGGRALLTTGSKELSPYTQVEGFEKRFFVRVLPTADAIGKCADAGFPPSRIIGMQGPFTRELNAAMLRQVGASWLVTKDSGAIGGTGEKIAAARDVGARCILIARPEEPGCAFTLGEVEDLLARQFASAREPLEGAWEISTPRACR